MKEFPDKVTLQIHHLDEGVEADLVMAAVGRAAQHAGCRIERPTEETNSFLVHCEIAPDKKSREEAMRLILRKAKTLLLALTDADVSTIRAEFLSIRLIVQTDAATTSLESDLLTACSTHGVHIAVWDMQKLMRGVTFRGKD
jgi:hypothetical protein